MSLNLCPQCESPVELLFFLVLTNKPTSVVSCLRCSEEGPEFVADNADDSVNLAVEHWNNVYTADHKYAPTVINDAWFHNSSDNKHSQAISKAAMEFANIVAKNTKQVSEQSDAIFEISKAMWPALAIVKED